MSRKHKNSDEIIFGISPMGGNAYDADNGNEGVPLFYDERVNAYISEQAIQELDDEDDSLIKAEGFRIEEEFRAKIGFRRS